MNESMHYQGYDGSVLYDKEDQRFHGKLVGIRDFVLYDGQTKNELEINFYAAVDEYLRFCKEDGKTPEVPFPSYLLRFPPDLHKRASLYAEQHDVEFNAVVMQAVTKYLAETEKAA